jgi:antitoxin (DNA-binding transcriptional repressor) of toxin-antitoxin stability system
MQSHEANRELATAIKEVKGGDSVILTDHGVAFAILEPLREASETEEHAIQELIEKGLLQPVRKSGTIREWRWKAPRSKVA